MADQFWHCLAAVVTALGSWSVGSWLVGLYRAWRCEARKDVAQRQSDKRLDQAEARADWKDFCNELRAQNQGQQKQIDELRDSVDACKTKHEECERKAAELSRQLTAKVTAMQTKISEVETKVANGSH